MFSFCAAGELSTISGFATAIVCVPPAATGSVPVFVPEEKVISLKGVVPILRVAPLEAPEDILAVTKMYPVFPVLITWFVKDGNTWLPTPREVVFSDNKVAVLALKIEDD